MAKGELLGHINCPSCGTSGGMRITKDKNGHPFGFCEAKCGQQLRVGGDLYRVGEFYRNYPHCQQKSPVTDTEKIEPVEEQKPAPVPEQKPEKKGFSLKGLGS